MNEDDRRKQLRFRSWYRGTREMDLLLGSFADTHLHGFSSAQLNDYEKLLLETDPDLYDWIAGGKPAPMRLNDALLQMLRAHRPVAATG